MSGNVLCLEELVQVTDRENNHTVEYNDYIINITDFVRKKKNDGENNKEKDKEYIFIRIKDNYHLNLDLLVFDKNKYNIEKNKATFSEKVPSNYKALLTLFLITESFSKTEDDFDENDVLDYMRKISLIFRLDIDKFDNKIKPNPYKLIIYYEWKTKKVPLVEIDFSLKDNVRQTMLIKLHEDNINYLTPKSDWHKFMGEELELFEIDKQFNLHNNEVYLNLPFNKDIQDAYNIYLKRYYKNKYVKVYSDYRDKVILTYELHIK